MNDLTPSAHGIAPKRRVPKGWRGIITSLAEQYRDADRRLKERGDLNDSQIIAVTISCYKGEQQYSHYGAEAAQALRNLVNYHRFLVVDYKMDFYRVRNVWAKVLNSSAVDRLVSAQN